MINAPLNYQNSIGNKVSSVYFCVIIANPFLEFWKTTFHVQLLLGSRVIHELLMKVSFQFIFFKIL